VRNIAHRALALLTIVEMWGAKEREGSIDMPRGGGLVRGSQKDGRSSLPWSYQGVKLNFAARYCTNLQ